MPDYTQPGAHHPQRRNETAQIIRRRGWCCSFTTAPLSPDYPAGTPCRSHPSSSLSKKAEAASYTYQTQQEQHRPPFARRILSPGRVSPISDHPVTTQEIPPSQILTTSSIPPADTGIGAREGDNLGDFDVRLNLRGKNRESLILELGSKVLSANSTFFADSIANCPKNASGLCRIEMSILEDVVVFRETIELMFEDDIRTKLQKIGVFRAIDTLEVSAVIKFVRGVTSCLEYIEAVPWSEQEEEKLRGLFIRCNFEDYATTDILDRLYYSYRHDAVDTQRALTTNLICSVTTARNANARNELKSLVKGLLCQSSVYEKKYPDLDLDIFAICQSCLASLRNLLEPSGSSTTTENLSKNVRERSLLESISNQVDNISWLVDILVDHQAGEEFVDLWANQETLLRIHQNLSPMVRYEISRVSAVLFVAMGTRKLHCPSETRLHFLQMWFAPMLCDFSWLQRSRKGLDMKVLEESMGQALLTLPLNDQYVLFMDWFRCFCKNGRDCPNLSKAFQIWWRRSFLRGSETFPL